MNDPVRVLVLDDDANLRKTVGDILKIKGFKPLLCTTGKAALERVQKQELAVALIDLRLEDMPGLEVLRGIKERSPQTECILLTGHASQATAIEAINLGAYSYFQKPVDMNQLLLAIQRAAEKREAERTIRATEAKLRALVEQVPAVIYTESADAPGKILYISPQVEAVTGYLPSEWTGSLSFWAEIVHPDDRESLLAEDERTGQTGEPFRIEYRLLKRDGSVLWMRDEAVLIRDEAGKPLFWQGVMHDITDRKLAEKAHRDSEARFTLIFQTSPIGMSITCTADGRVIEVNPAFLDMFGFTRDEVIGHTTRELKVWANIEERDMLMKTLDKSGQIRNFETKFRRKSGQIGDLLVSADVIDLAGEQHMLAEMLDITDRKQAEQALRESEERFRSVFENASMGIYRTAPDGQILLANPAICRLLGYDSFEELAQRNLEQDSYGPEYSRSQFRELIERQGQVLGLETYWKTKNGKIIHVCESARAIRDGKGNVLYYEGTAEDITERKRAEKALSESEERFSSLFENMAEGVALHQLVFDEAGRAVNYRLVDINPQYEQILGLVRHQVVGSLATEVYGEAEPPYLQEYSQVAASGVAVHFETFYPAPNKFFRISVAPWGQAGFATIFTDITERKRAEEALARTERIYRQAITQAGSVPYQRDYRGEKYAFLGEGFETLTGYTPEEMTGPLFTSRLRQVESYGEYKHLAHEARIQLARQGGFKDWREDYMFERKDGSLIWLADHSVPVYGDNGEVMSSLGILTDITERKQAEQALASQAEELRRRNEELARLYRASGSLISGAALNLQELGGKIVEVVQQEFGQANCSLIIVRKDSNELARLAIAGAYADEVKDKELTLNGPGLVSQAIRTGKTFNVPDVRSAPEYVPNWAAAQSELTIPLKLGNDVIGAIDVQSAAAGAFNADDERLMSIFAERAALVLEHSRLNTQTEVRIQQLVALRTVDMAISGSFDIALTLGVLLDQVTGVLGLHAADILIYNAATQAFKLAGERGFRTHMLQHTQLNLGMGYAWRVVRERRMVVISNLQAESAGMQRFPDLSGEQFVTYMGLPLIAKGQTQGVLEIFHREPVKLEPEWIGFLELLAGQAAIAIDNVELFNNLQASNAELSMAYDSTLEGWASALELRDHETEGHTRRTTELTVRIAQAMGIKDNDIVHIYRGALLHDIGKMGVPDSIMLKPGPLTDEEWVSMRKHPQYAFDMLAPIAYLRQALDIPYCHHEKWDGTGYPRGLKGEQIPLTARIFAIVDVWDALTSDRPYRKAWTKEKALEHIREQAGSHFDPKVVEIFLREEKHA